MLTLVWILFLIFKQVKKETENTFTIKGKNGFYEKIYSNVEIYNLRRNGNEFILTEVVYNYDFCYIENSKQDYEILINNIEKIKKTDILSPCSNTYYPECILFSTGHVVKKEKKKRC